MALAAKTEHIHVVRNKDICGGKPIIKGTRTTVRSIACYYKMGLSVEEIAEGLTHLKPAQIYDALSYYFDHQEEIKRDIEENKEESVIKRHPLTKTPKNGKN